MNKKKTLLSILYSLSPVAILYYPVSKIIKFETSPDCEEFKFNATVYDPYDPMRGRYVQLDIMPSRWKTSVRQPDDLYYGAYVVIKKNRSGFAEILRLEKNLQPLKKGEFAIKQKGVFRTSERNSNSEVYHLKWPFNRFYLNELKAPELEKELQKRNNPVVLKVKIFRDGSFAVTGMEK